MTPKSGIAQACARYRQEAEELLAENLLLREVIRIDRPHFNFETLEDERRGPGRNADHQRVYPEHSLQLARFLGTRPLAAHVMCILFEHAPRYMTRKELHAIANIGNMFQNSPNSLMPQLTFARQAARRKGFGDPFECGPNNGLIRLSAEGDKILNAACGAPARKRAQLQAAQ